MPMLRLMLPRRHPAVDPRRAATPPMRYLTLTLPVALLLTLAAPAFGAEAVRAQIIVGVHSGTTHARGAALVKDAGGRVARQLDRIGAGVVRPRHGSHTRALRKRLRRLSAVRYAEPDFIVAKSV